MQCIKVSNEDNLYITDDYIATHNTTSVILLAREMCVQELPKNSNVISVKRGIKKATESCVEELKKISQDVKDQKDFEKVARTSCQDDEMAKVITEAFVNSGEDGAIDIQRKSEPGIEYEKIPGISFDTGYLVPNCANARRNVAQQDEVHILVTDKDITSQHSLVPIGTALAEKGIKQLCIVCNDLQRDAKGLVERNNHLGAFHFVPIKAPSHGLNKIGILKDIAAATGANFLSEEHMGNKLETATLDDLGKAKKVTVEPDKSIILFEDNEETSKRLFERIVRIKDAIEEEDNEMEKKNLEHRLATLTDGVTTIKVEGHTQQEYRELRTRAEDAVRALQSTREEGAVPGCGVTYLLLLKFVTKLLESTKDEDEATGIKIVRNALTKPAMRILEVAGIPDKELIVSRMKETGKGYNFQTGELDDMMKLGVWDSTKSIRCCLEYSASVASNFLSIGSAVAREPEVMQTLREFGQIIKPR